MRKIVHRVHRAWVRESVCAGFMEGPPPPRATLPSHSTLSDFCWHCDLSFLLAPVSHPAATYFSYSSAPLEDLGGCGPETQKEPRSGGWLRKTRRGPTGRASLPGQCGPKSALLLPTFPQSDPTNSPSEGSCGQTAL